MADIVEAHAEQVKRNVTAQPNSRHAFVTETLLDEGIDELVPDHAQERVPHIVLMSLRQWSCVRPHLRTVLVRNAPFRRRNACKHLGFEDHDAVVRGFGVMSQ